MDKNINMMKRYGIFAFLFAIFLLGGCRTAGNPGDAALGRDRSPIEVPASSADDLVVVDCLLPGQVRMLGNMTYLTPRRPAKLTALECRIRGGEYVAYDRANLQTALAVWLPEAEQGDPTAQTYVGEIYLRGGGTGQREPQYAKAAQWFRKAADKGFERARISLGYLYEKGLGVPKDPVKALKLYRSAAGGDTDLVLASSGLSGSERRELQGLRRQVEALRKRLDEAHRNLTQTRADFKWQTAQIRSEREGLKRARADLARLKAEAPRNDPNAGKRLAALEKSLSQREAALEAQHRHSEQLKKRVQKLEAASSRYKKQLAKYKDVKISENQEILALRREVTQRRQEAQTLRTQLARKRGELKRVHGDYTWLQEQIGAEREGLKQARSAMEKREEKDSAAARNQSQEMEKKLADRQARLDALEKEAAGLRKKVSGLEADASRYKQQLAGYKEKLADLPKPSIEVIKPKVLATRGQWVAMNNSRADRMELVGKVLARAGLYSLSVNDKPARPGSGGLFKAWVSLTPSADTPVLITAVDRQGKRTDMRFVIPEPAPPAAARGIDPKLFGKYYALVIGNNDYQSLPPLTTAIADAQDVGKLLQDKYGFTTQVLTDATRFQIYKALDNYRRTLTDKDNFLLYYAGHGQLDRKNQRGYWLPVNADPDSYINSIPNFTVTDILNNMTVKEAIIIADTCYSGILTRSVVSVAPSGMSREKRLKWLEKIAGERSRTVLSSGGLKPVLDTGASGHSLFANALLDVLQNNRRIMTASAIYRQVRTRVAQAARRMGFQQVPQYAANLQAGHIAGDFLFVPR